MKNKCCGECNKIKLVSEYYKHKTNLDGLEGKCKSCKNQYSVKWQQDHPKNVKKINTKFRKNNPKKILKFVKNTNNKLGAGIYEITNLLIGYNYIGETLTLQRRKYEHFGMSKLTNVSNTLLHNDVLNYSPDAFSFTILEHLPADKKILLERERYWINKLNPTYNIK